MVSEEARNYSEHSSTDMYSRVKLRASDGRVYAGRHGDSDVENVISMNVQCRKFRICDDINSRGIDKKKEGMDFIIRPKKLAIGGSNTFAGRSTKMAHLMPVTEHEGVISSREIKGNERATEGQANLDFDFLDSTLDAGTALEMLDAFQEGRSKNLGYGYEMGDMVWAKVKSHPWWPGQIFDEAFASPSVGNTKKGDHMLVAFFGDSTYGWFEPVGLIPFDPHYTEKSKQTNTQEFLTAVGEAEDEVSRRAALGMTCYCWNSNNFRSTSVKGFFEVDVSGFEPCGVYSVTQIERARDGFQPSKTLPFVQQLALMPENDVKRNVEWMENVAQVLAYRRAVFEEFDATYAQAFGAQQLCLGGSAVGLNDQKKAPFPAPLSGQPVITEALGESKGFADRIKVKDQQKRKTYISRWSDEVNISRPQQLSKTGGCVSQKRPPLITMKSIVSGNQDACATFGRDFAALRRDNVGKVAITADKNPTFAMHSLLDAQDNRGNVESPGGLSVGFPITQSSSSTTGFHDSNLLAKPKSTCLTILQKCEAQVDVKMTGTRPTKSPLSIMAVEKIPAKNLRDQSSALKSLKKRLRPDDPAKASHKCQVSGHRENMATERPKKLSKMKSLPAEKKEGNQKSLKVQADEKMVGPSVLTKPIKNSCRTRETPERASEPTMLLMEFPPRTTLPSGSELKARFARFGKLDESATRVFWKSSTCWVVFKNVSSAQAAYNNAVRNRTLFGNKKVNYHLRSLKVSASKLPESFESREWLAEEAPGKIPTSRSLITGDSAGEPSSTALQQLPLHPSVHLKSCLKDSPGDEMESFNRVRPDTPPIELMLGGNASNGSIVGNYLNPISFSSTAINENVAKVHEVVSPTLLPLLSLSSCILEMHENCRVDDNVNVINMKYSQAKARNNQSYSNTNATTSSIDISQQMLNLLRKCSDIVAYLKGSSGYVPYHALCDFSCRSCFQSPRQHMEAKDR